MSSSSGSSFFAFFWATKNIPFSYFLADCNGARDFSLPTKRGTIMWGNTTTSLKGNTGIAVIISSFSLSMESSIVYFPVFYKAALSRFGFRFKKQNRLFSVNNNLFRNHAFLHIMTGRNIVHDI